MPVILCSGSLESDSRGTCSSVSFGAPPRSPTDGTGAKLRTAGRGARLLSADTHASDATHSATSTVSAAVFIKRINYLSPVRGSFRRWHRFLTSEIFDSRVMAEEEQPGAAGGSATDTPAPSGAQQPGAEAPHASAASRADEADQQASESMAAGGKDAEGAEPGGQGTSNSGEGEGVEARALSVGICARVRQCAHACSACTQAVERVRPNQVAH